MKLITVAMICSFISSATPCGTQDDRGGELEGVQEFVDGEKLMDRRALESRSVGGLEDSISTSSIQGRWDTPMEEYTNDRLNNVETPWKITKIDECLNLKHTTILTQKSSPDETNLSKPSTSSATVENQIQSFRLTGTQPKDLTMQTSRRDVTPMIYPSTSSVGPSVRGEDWDQGQSSTSKDSPFDSSNVASGSGLIDNSYPEDYRYYIQTQCETLPTSYVSMCDLYYIPNFVTLPTIDEIDVNEEDEELPTPTIEEDLRSNIENQPDANLMGYFPTDLYYVPKFNRLPTICEVSESEEELEMSTAIADFRNLIHYECDNIDESMCYYSDDLYFVRKYRRLPKITEEPEDEDVVVHTEITEDFIKTHTDAVGEIEQLLQQVIRDSSSHTHEK